MPNRLSTLAAALAFAVASSLWTSPAAADVLRLGGKSGASALMVHLGQAFTRWAGIAVEVVPGLGSTGSLNALAEGVLDVAIAGRGLSPAQSKRGFVQVATLQARLNRPTFTTPISAASDPAAIAASSATATTTIISARCPSDLAMLNTNGGCGGRRRRHWQWGQDNTRSNHECQH